MKKVLINYVHKYMLTLLLTNNFQIILMALYFNNYYFNIIVGFTLSLSSIKSHSCFVVLKLNNFNKYFI